MPNLANFDYVDRLNRSIDYVTQNLDKPLNLEAVAAAACFSPYHFHRIFRELMGETLGSFIKRVRLERSVYLLSHRKRSSLTAIAHACGFSSSSDFSRAFRTHYGVAPSKFDVDQFRRSGSDAMRATLATLDAPHRLVSAPAENSLTTFAVNLREVPERHVAYIRVHRPYEGDHVQQAAARLLRWADARGFADGQWLGYQWEDPEIVALDQCRYDIGIEVPPATRVEGEVSTMVFPACKVAEIEIKGGIDLELRALQWLYGEWLPNSGYAPAHQPMFEAFNGRPFAHGLEYFELRAQLVITDENTPV
ncbi:MAG TPA: GyrI-like domain-containing protein [Thermoanaerobaculia bacterium]|nr:GyrI-like domain-containing protein [Thermoanaerobaculia bacterium]